MVKSQSSARIRSLPDVATTAQPQLAGTLDWVGMDNIQLPVCLVDASGQRHQVSARVQAHVNLIRADQRGIHMSRLYLALTHSLPDEPLSLDGLERVLQAMLESHAGLADRAELTIRYEQLVQRPSLHSDHSGWRSYPIVIRARSGTGKSDIELGIEVMYSSTCPASAALARDLIGQQFARDFPTAAPIAREQVLAWLAGETGMVATPHAQRSVARVWVRPDTTAGLDTIGLIDRVEAALGTAVQTAVKREDEQAFARANGDNLMFCEDASRRIQRALNQDDGIRDFIVRVAHEESLHPHDAVAWATKGVAGGYDAAAQLP